MTQPSSEFEAALGVEPLLLARENRSWLADAPTSLKKLATQIKPKKHRFVFTGTGSSYHVARWAQWLFRGAGLRSFAIKAFDVLTNPALLLDENDVLVVVSHRGAQGLTGQLIKATKKHKNVILLSGSEAPDGGRVQLYTAFPEVSKAHSQSLVGTMSALIALLSLWAKPEAQKIEKQRVMAAELLYGALSIDHGDTLPNEFQSLHFVGSGLFEPVAMELALKAMEVVHIPALAHHAEEFLHGPVAAVSAEDAIVFLGTASAGTALEKRRLEDGVQAANAVGASIVKPMLPAKLHPALQAVVALGFGQGLCLALSRNFGTNPDSNHQEDPRYRKAFEFCQF